MTIECANRLEFYDAIYELTKLGLGFKAKAADLSIRLTGTL